MPSCTYNVLKALWMAKTAHAGQKYGEEDYFNHPLRVALAFEDPRDQVVALLHDTVEDTSLGLAEIENAFGAEVALDVDTLTRRKGEVYLSEYIPRVGRSRSARKIKIVDLRENIRATKESHGKNDRLLPRYQKALAYLETLELEPGAGTMNPL